jgi:hypothetical protein
MVLYTTRSAPLTVLLISMEFLSCKRTPPASPPVSGAAASDRTAVAAPSPRPDRDLALVRYALSAIGRSLSPAQTAALLGGALQPTESHLSWSVALGPADRTAIIDVRPDGAMDTIRLGFGTDTPLRLSDLSTEFGNYQSIHEGEESSVRFRSPAGIDVSVWLFSSRILPNASVLRVFLRRADR